MELFGHPTKQVQSPISGGSESQAIYGEYRYNEPVTLPGRQLINEVRMVPASPNETSSPD